MHELLDIIAELMGLQNFKDQQSGPDTENWGEWVEGGDGNIRLVKQSLQAQSQPQKL